MSGSFRASVGHNPLLRVKRANPSLAAQSVSLSIAPVVDVPINFLAQTSGSSINLSWNRGPLGQAPTDYDIDYSTVGFSGPWTTISHSGSSTTDQLGPSLAVGTYYFRVLAKVGAFSSAYTTTQASVSLSTRTLYASATFDSGSIAAQPTSASNSAGRMNSGLQIRTLPDPQSGFAVATSNNGGFGAGTSNDVKVVTAETVTDDDSDGVSRTDNVVPRSGPYFLRAKIFRAKPHTDMGTNKHYDGLNGSDGVHVDADCKPRCAFDFNNDAAYGFGWDTEVWFGWSIYLPRSWQHETFRTGQTSNGPMMMTINPSTASATHMTLNLIVPTAGQNWRNASNGNLVSATNETHWCIIHNLDPSSTTESGATPTKVSLGSIVPDMGKWTDLVFRLRFNPFAVAPGAPVNGYTMRGNTGLIHIWKSTGAVDGNGNRTISEANPTYQFNGPCGLRPHPSNKLTFSSRVYMFGLNSTITTTSRTHPLWAGIDEMRWGFAEGSNVGTWQSGAATGFDDVVPNS